MDEARLRPHLRAIQQPKRLPFHIAIGQLAAPNIKAKIVTPSPGELRGIPVVGRAGGAGAIRGSDPVGALLGKENAA